MNDRDATIIRHILRYCDEIDAAVERFGDDREVLADYSLRTAVQDSRSRRNLFGPYDTAETAVAAMIEDDQSRKKVPSLRELARSV